MLLTEMLHGKGSCPFIKYPLAKGYRYFQHEKGVFKTHLDVDDFDTRSEQYIHLLATFHVVHERLY